MPTITPEQRREMLKKRAAQSLESGQETETPKERKTVLDLSKVNKKVNWYKPKSGAKNKNLIDILPFRISQPWYEKLLTYPKDFGSKIRKPTGIPVGYDDYKLEVPVHYVQSKGQILCLREAFGEKCVRCDDMFAEYAKRGTDDYSETTAQSLRPQWRCFYNVYDYNDPDKDIQLWDFAYNLFEKYVLEKGDTSDEGQIVFSDLLDGRTIEWIGRDKTGASKGEGKGKGRSYNYIEAGEINFKMRTDPYDESVLNDVFPLDAMLVIPTPQEVADFHYGYTPTRQEPEAPKETQNAAPRRRPPTTQVQEEKPVQASSKPINELELDTCPGNGEVGVSYQQLPECETCETERFERCGTEYDKKKLVPKQEAAPQPRRRR